MKRGLVLISFFTAFAITGIFLGFESYSRTETKPSLHLPDGPDKAILRDYYMMKDPATGQVPFDRLRSLKEIPPAARMESHRDFQWRNYDTGRPGRGRFIFQVPGTTTLFSGSVTGGLYVNKTYQQSGGRWEKVNSFPDISVSRMAADPLNPNRLYVGTGESFTAFLNYRESTGIGNGIYVSEDAGETWTQISSTSSFLYINDLIVREEDGTGVLYVAVGSGSYRGLTHLQEGLYRSADQGTTWSQVLPETPTGTNYQVSDIELASDNRIYLGTMRNGSENDYGSIILSSSDGLNWSLNNSIYQALKPLGGYPGRIIINSALSNPDRVYILATNGYYNGLDQLRDYEIYLYQSFDGGSSWSDLPLPNHNWANIPWHALTMAIDPQEEDRIIIGALNMYMLNSTNPVPNQQVPWIRLSLWSAMYQLQGDLTQEERDYVMSYYIHGDLHDIIFFDNDPNHLLVTTDGGVFGTTNLSDIHSFNYEVDSKGIAKFSQTGIGLNTTQYYAVALHPDQGNYSFLGGTQDNGSILVNDAEGNLQESWISGGDGGYVFWDSDNPELKITSVYGNRWFIHLPDTVYSTRWIDGLFVNPGDYDDESNLIYTNPSTSPNGGLYWGLRGRFYDSLRILNVNKYLETGDLGLDTTVYVPLNAGIREAITAVKLSPHSSKLDKTLFIGTEYGKIFKVTGLPYDPVTTRLDNNRINMGYISSLDVGESDAHILATLSNFGISSVYTTYNSGENWQDLQRDLPDMPVRWGVFNPQDDRKIMIATENGVWGLENTFDQTEIWHSYNGNMPGVRVDMIKVRKEDNAILAGTHGAGLWWGNYDQGEPLTTSVKEKAEPDFAIYPNPFISRVYTTRKDIKEARLYDTNGQLINVYPVEDGEVDLSDFPSGRFIIEYLTNGGKVLPSRTIIKN